MGISLFQYVYDFSHSSKANRKTRKICVENIRYNISFITYMSIKRHTMSIKTLITVKNFKYNKEIFII